MTISSVNNDTPSGIAKYWLQRVRAQPDPCLPKSTRYGLCRRNRGQFLISDAKETDGTASLWTDSQDNCQVYYDLENAFRCAGILASLTNEDIEVVALDE
jgi:hypothetical protein